MTTNSFKVSSYRRQVTTTTERIRLYSKSPLEDSFGLKHEITLAAQYRMLVPRKLQAQLGAVLKLDLHAEIFSACCRSCLSLNS